MNNDMFTILIVEDDKAIIEMLSISLQAKHYHILKANTGAQAISLLGDNDVDLVLLDWMLPDVDGTQLIGKIRKFEGFQYLPIMMLTAKSNEEDKVKGFDMGADDYMTKPVLLKELDARIRSLLRRSQGLTASDELIVDNIIINPVQQLLTIGGKAITIGSTEFRLLHFLMKNKNRVFNRSQLLDGVWGRFVAIDERTVDVHILRLRKILKPYEADNYIQTVRNMGYRFSINTTS
ncbi:Phosphate regulon transcriptional regulatory protein PhoB (SphR) [uncultured Gammaproteobacteria bacterium]|jgi:two-component system phosphate regulon response regulator PhoB|uniref:response regulator n=1 Tax=thiotrophic endosymbiont of Bathymodiolus puteoserpentis (Logatchev) TaxID=343240 RepID=UPI0010B22948|nr:response regulator [thiotrophic endosymbiont of Bathymodiolus puteoserpentis (Logatchev)]CAC9497711.1 Phosphate regulon transcriptional regulatory protein PhoB (SphR) [uncultured Gammaproteobacteria bacterium]CAC9499293.1 Phosphate regulon transcriptional regulatory protein PhoB (SphR) [uncultured Gammaproteobacteria bacterium]CAC9651324.1 Phosphate regulon transcriptional regulatory protein PhoB (SphR) [uncultured Gammaproteobacteria bacterium]CAC9985350.1 Phosphate regulon transcriptional 